MNTRTHHVRHGNGGEYRWLRNTKAEQASTAPRGSMHGGLQHGRDYTPLFRFLLSSVGRPWAEIYSEAKGRLDTDEPIFWLVARSELEERAIVRTGESSYFSGLKVDTDGYLVRAAPDLSVDDLWPTCACCTHSLNGERFTRLFDPARRSLIEIP